MEQQKGKVATDAVGGKGAKAPDKRQQNGIELGCFKDLRKQRPDPKKPINKKAR